MGEAGAVVEKLRQAAAAVGEAKEAMRRYRRDVRDQDFNDLLFHWGRELGRLEEWLQRCAQDVQNQSGGSR